MKLAATLALLLALAGPVCAQAKGTIAGRVVDAKGHPVAGAEVRAVSKAGEDGGTARTDAKGNYRVDVAPGEYRLEVEAEGYATATLRDSVTAEAGHVTKVKRKVQLPESDQGSLVRGSVFTDGGRSLAGATVTIERVTADGAAPAAFKRDAESDRMGVVAFKVPKGEFRYLVTARHEGFETRSTTIDLSGGETVNVALTLPAKK